MCVCVCVCVCVRVSPDAFPCRLLVVDFGSYTNTEIRDAKGGPGPLGPPGISNLFTPGPGGQYSLGICALSARWLYHRWLYCLLLVCVSKRCATFSCNSPAFSSIRSPCLHVLTSNKPGHKSLPPGSPWSPWETGI